MAKSEEKAKKLVPEHFHKWIHVFGKKRLCNRDERRVCTKKREGLSIVEGGERRYLRVH